MKTAQAIVEILKREGVEFVIGYPVNPILEFAARADVRPIIVRQERTGLHMADAVSRVSSGKRIGVFAMQHGPGSENAFGGVAQAWADSVPIVVLPMGYPRKTTNIPPNFNSALNFRHVTKWAEQMPGGSEVANVMRRAFTQVRNGRPGPVLVEVPMDVFGEDAPEPLEYRPSTRHRSAPDPAAVTAAVDALLGAARPVLYAGQGVHYAEAWDELRALAELLALPVCTSLQGKSAFPEGHPLALGAGGRTVTGPLHHFLGHADLVLGVGCSFSSTDFGVKMPSGKRYIHATVDAFDVNKDLESSLALLGDAKLTLQAMLGVLRERGTAKRDPAPVAREIAEVKAKWLEQWRGKRESDEVPLNPYRVLAELRRAVDPDRVIITHDSGSPRDQLSPFWESTLPLSYIGWGKSTAARLRARPRHGRQARAPGPALHQRLGRRRDRLHRHGLRDRGARAHPDPLDPPQQLLDGDRAADHEGVDREVRRHQHLGRLRRDGARLRRLRRARHRARSDRARDPARHRADRAGDARAARVPDLEGDRLLDFP